MSGGDDLIASYFTLTGTPVGEPPRFTFEDRVAAAAAAGFAGVGLLSDDYAAMRDAGTTDDDLRHVLDSHGVRILEIEFHFDWAADDELTDAARRREATLHAMADAFSPHHLNVGELSDSTHAPPRDVTVERFAGVCDRAADHGTRVALEFLPWTAIPDLQTAWDIVRAAGRPNGGVLVDAWHYFRGRPDDRLLRSLAPQHVVAVQIDDADPDPVGPSWEDTMLRRRLPGEGAFDLTGLFSALDDIGVDVPYSVEILSTEHQALEVRDAAARAHDTTRAALHRARAR